MGNLYFKTKIICNLAHLDWEQCRFGSLYTILLIAIYYILYNAHILYVYSTPIHSSEILAAGLFLRFDRRVKDSPFRFVDAKSGAQLLASFSFWQFIHLS